MKIAVDFDGTIVTHMFPEIGEPVPGALDYMKQWQAAGAKLILWTMRSDRPERNYLLEAVSYCAEGGVEFDGVNHGINDRRWTDSPKAHAHIYLDDAAYGVPLIYPGDGQRPYVNWAVAGPDILERIKNAS